MSCTISPWPTKGGDCLGGLVRTTRSGRLGQRIRGQDDEPKWDGVCAQNNDLLHTYCRLLTVQRYLAKRESLTYSLGTFHSSHYVTIHYHLVVHNGAKTFQDRCSSGSSSFPGLLNDHHLIRTYIRGRGFRNLHG